MAEPQTSADPPPDRDAALHASAARHDAIIDSIDQLIWSTRPDGHHDYYNRRWYEFTGMPEGSTNGKEWNGVFHPEDRERAWAVWRHSLATGERYQIEYRLRHRSGQYRWVIGRAQCVRDEAGRILRWYGTCTDIHDLKEAEEARELIARELSHRIKNIFAVVSSLLSLSAADRPEAQEFADDVDARIRALAVAHEYVRPHSAESGPPDGARTLHGLLGMLTAPYEAPARARIAVAGQDAPIGPAAATALALVVHELLTNAVKYGALSSEVGAVGIALAFEGDVLSLTWCERGGPEVAGEPSRHGFGTTLSEQVVAAQLGARIERTWKAEGLSVVISVDRRRLDP
jgi:PAS domain S-box-containing protein